VKFQRQDSFSIPPVKKDSKLHTDSKVKAEIMLEEIKSVFTQEDKSHTPSVHGTSYAGI